MENYEKTGDFVDSKESPFGDSQCLIFKDSTGCERIYHAYICNIIEDFGFVEGQGCITKYAWIREDKVFRLIKFDKKKKEWVSTGHYKKITKTFLKKEQEYKQRIIEDLEGKQTVA